MMSKLSELPVDWQHDEFMGLNVAKYRAAHQILDDPQILKDPLALRIIGAEAESKLRQELTHFQRPELRAFRAGVMIRNRYAEDELARLIQSGARQYMILGAGLDTFAYRNPFPFLRVFEVDHPATQVWKRAYLEKAAIPIPTTVTYVPVDFERAMLAEVLKESGFKNDEITFVSLIGVVRYLTWEHLKLLLSAIVSSIPAGSELVLDFGPPPPLQQRLRELIANRKSKNKSFRPSYFEPVMLKQHLQEIGFTDVELFGPEELNARYCKNRTDGLRIENQMHLVKACV